MDASRNLGTDMISSVLVQPFVSLDPHSTDAATALTYFISDVLTIPFLLGSPSLPMLSRRCPFEAVILKLSTSFDSQLKQMIFQSSAPNPILGLLSNLAIRAPARVPTLLRSYLVIFVAMTACGKLIFSLLT